MKLLTKSDLLNVFEKCEKDKSGIEIKLKMTKQTEPEIIINHYKS